MLAIGFIIGIVVAGPICFVLGAFAERDRRVTHEPADIRPALRRAR